MPWQVHERGTVYRQLSVQPPHRLLPLEKNLNHFCLDCHSVCDNSYCSLTMFSALAAVCTVDCAIEIVLITLHRITFPPPPAHRALSQVAAARTGPRFGPGWRRRPGRPRRSWIQQIGDGTPFSIRAEWSEARRRGHSGLTQRTSDVYTRFDDDGTLAQ